MFDGFVLDRVDLGQVSLRVRHGGAGPAVVLLHGHPRTHTTWWQVAPQLAESFTVVCPDLRGYGQSGKPSSMPDHMAYSKRAMADDIAVLMTTLGYDRFAVVGHDRGAYVAHRLALDQAARTTHLVVLDAVPIGAALERADARFATLWWHWFFLGQTDKPAEAMINADPQAWYRGDESQMGTENYADFLAAIHDHATVHAMCEDYRAGLGIDRRTDEADHAAGRRVACPMLMLWATRDDMADLYGDPLAVWREWALDVRGHAIASSHHIAEDNPKTLAHDLLEFLTS